MYNKEIPTSQIAREAKELGLNQQEFNEYLRLRRKGYSKQTIIFFELLYIKSRSKE